MEPTASVYAKAEALADHLHKERVLLLLDGCEPLQDAAGDMKDSALKALREASTAYGNHALALTLLGTYLADFCEKDVRRRIEIPKLMVDDLKVGVHARHVMAAYARMFEGKPELEILRALAYFDRPDEPPALKLVLPAMPDLRYKAALKRLRAARLILTKDPSAPLDCHPLIREHFAAVMQETAPDAFRGGHSRLYEYYCKQAPHRPDTLEQMTPLFYAVYHGCQAGRHPETLYEVYFARIRRGDEAYLIHNLGAFGTNLSLLANFFQSAWTASIPSLSPADQSWVISESAFALRALGRLPDAVNPEQLGAEGAVKLDDWKNASIRFGNLSELQLTLGNVKEAIAAARQAVDFADRSDKWSQRLGKRTALANALHQSGSLAEAASRFEEAERLQAEEQPDYPTLYSQRGYQYCDLLLSQGQTSAVLRRATRTLRWVEEVNWLSDIGLNHLSLCRAHPTGSAESAMHLNQAVDYLRRSGHTGYLPSALLARGTPHDLDEIFRIATRSGLRLHLTDYHLAMARRHKSREHFLKAEALIAATGYHRRDAELESLRHLLET